MARKPASHTVEKSVLACGARAAMCSASAGGDSADAAYRDGHGDLH